MNSRVAQLVEHETLTLGVPRSTRGPAAKPRGFAAVGLFAPKNSLNVGSALRAAGCYGAAMVAVGGERPKRFLKRVQTDTQKAYRHLPLIGCDDLRTVIPFDCVPVAIECIDGARSLIDYQHPERAFYIFGPEDGTLGRQVTDWCRDVIQIPTHYCMNLAATVNVVLYDRMAKQAIAQTKRGENANG